MLFPSKAGGPSFRLGAQDPNATSGFLIEQGTRATKKSEGGVTYWNVPSHGLSYAAGGTGVTSRLHMFATGTTQSYTWKTEQGFLGSPNDLKNQEMTVYVRPHTITDVTRAAFSLKVRGGRHTNDGDLASCTMLQLRPAGKDVATFAKELTHPYYDFVRLTKQTEASLQDNAWVGLKLVTYQLDATRVLYRLYVDTSPFGADGKPANDFKLFSEYTDVAGKSTGRYSTLADWGGMQTTFRTDGIASIDFAFISVREIAPPV